jgi:putative nucleotidyltransferase with HDIG domain
MKGSTAMQSEVQVPASGAQPLSAAQLAVAARALGACGGGAGVTQLMALLCNADAEMSEVVRCLKSEPGLAARVLKVANSPFYRQSGNVGSVDRALQVLGFTAVRGIAAAGCMDRLPVPSFGGAINADRFRRHSLAVACAAQELSKRLGARIDSEAFMAGLLHDIGVLLIGRLRPDADSIHLDLPAGDAASLLAAETATFGAQHAELSAALVTAWGLPASLGHSLASHHAPALVAPDAFTGDAALPAVLAMADAVVNDAGLGLWQVGSGEPDLHWVESLGLSADVCADVAAELPALIDRLAPG